MSTKDFLNKHEIHHFFNWEKNMTNLLRNGFSYWEAVRIANNENL